MTDAKPQRLQLSRKRGFNLQAASRTLNGLEAVNVARPSKFGNPFDFRKSDFCWLALSFGCRGDAAGRQEASVRAFQEWISPGDGKRTAHMDRQVVMVFRGSKRKKVPIGAKMEAGIAPSLAEVIAELRGKNVACWCPIGSPCHGQILLELANKEPSS